MNLAEYLCNTDSVSYRYVTEALKNSGHQNDVYETLTALHHACIRGHTDTVSLLIKSGANLNARTMYYQLTPLHICLDNNRLDLAWMLINAGANVNAKDYKGLTPLCYAMWNRQEHMVSRLLTKGADPYIKDNEGKTPEALLPLIQYLSGKK